MVNTISSKLAKQLPLEIVQRNVAFVPAAMPVMVVVGEEALVIVAAPDCTLHKPVPTNGTLATIGKVLLLHWSRLTPASATVGLALLVSTTSSKLGAHTPLLIVQRNVALVPTGTPVTPLLKVPAAVIVAVPDTTVHKPVPTTGLLPPSVKAPLLHCSWSAPAVATVGVA